MERLWKLLGNLVILIIGLKMACSLETVNNQADKKLPSTENTTAYRLPEHVVPDTYFIRLTPFIAMNNSTFDGLTRIVANVMKKTSNIILHVNNLKINNVTVTSFDKQDGLSKLGVKNVTEKKKYQFLNIEMDQPIDANTNITITIPYTGKINDEMKGLFRNSYTINNETRWVLSTQFEPTGARSVFPCFDEPAFRAIFHVSVIVPKNYTAISNMPIETITKGGIYKFEKTLLMPTYLVAVIVSDFTNLTMNDGNRTYGVWVQSQLTHQLPYSLSVIPKALSFFETRLGVPYPLLKVDMVALPDFPSEAMENWGLQVYSEKLMLDEPTATPLSVRRYIRNLVTHEHSHQWFGNLVTPKWWDYLWLNEGFAQYFEYHAYEGELSHWNLESQYVVDVLQPALVIDADESTHPITNKVYSPSQIGAMFDNISYNKAGSVIRMLEKVLGPKMFYGALGRYLQKNKYSTGTPKKLYEAFEEEIKFNNYKLHASIAEVMDTWTVQAGFPVVNVELTGNRISIKQKRFFLQPPKKFTFNTAWCIPITWATQSNPDFSDTKTLVWVRDNVTSIPIENASQDWVIFNVQQTGFYRVNYDNLMWNRIIDTLKSNKFVIIHEINRASLIDDLFNLGRVGEVDYDTVLSATQYLKNETNYIPWKAALAGFSYLKTRLVGHPEVYNHFEAYVTTLLMPIYKKLGFSEKSNDSHFDLLLREQLLNWLCSFDHEDCVSEARSTFNTLQQSKNYVISPNQQGFIYCTVIKHGSMKEYDYLWQRFVNSIYSIEKHTILTALTCSRNPANIEKLLIDVFTLKHGIKQEQMSDLVISIAKNNEFGLPTILNYLEKHFDDFVEYINDERHVQDMIKSISEQFTSVDQINKLDAIMKTNQQKISSILESVQSSLENANYDLNRLGNYSPKILNWLKNHK